MENAIEWINDIPQPAIQAGEGVNLWCPHIVLQPDRLIFLLYNTGSYGNERMFGRYVPGDDSLLIERVMTVTSKDDMG
jgi:hypothetical protein